MNNLDKDTPVWQLTLGELIYSIKQSFPQNIHFPIENDDEDHYITGLKELSKYLGISYSLTSKLKREGVFDRAIKQRNRTIIINKRIAIECFAEIVK